MDKEKYKLTERGLYWLKIDTANTYGLDKLSHDEQVDWFDINIKHKVCTIECDEIKNKLILEAESPFEFKQCLENYEMYLAGRPVNGLMYVVCNLEAWRYASTATARGSSKNCSSPTLVLICFLLLVNGRKLPLLARI